MMSSTTSKSWLKRTDTEWRFRRSYAYHTYGDDWGDSFKDFEEDNIRVMGSADIFSQTQDEIVRDAYNYLFDHEEGVLRYPGKSFAVALIYARLLAKHFGGSHRDYLKQDDLLPDDPYFHSMKGVAISVYEQLLRTIPDGVWDHFPFHNGHLPYVQRTIEYFYKEYMLDEKGLAILPRREENPRLARIDE